ncbi:Gas1-like protein [Lasiodiplodia theobromae]|uniref:Gas1-like protein n=1 Tax=Lasiodiplodia theobromae TaxID=45133 RepID=UPI0015C3F507|nr:Gas1-like protein [Lasiodiplodia theobromae]KAF4546409.1 Gas1-like protein [Lasiodiplodia theobromae]
MQFTSFVALLAGASTVYAHGVILAAEGDSGKSQGFLVNENVARNCTEINPCQQDSVIIRDAEITQNIVNGCGRTELNGNIDIGEQTENELAANRMTQVSKGSSVAVTIHQVNADGAGPYECDLDESSNAGTFQKLEVSNNVPGENGLSDAKFKDFTINVQLPDNLNCTGASTGNICTVRCRNNALAGPFGGCFAVQQTDTEGRPQNQAASEIETAQTLDGISKQIQVNQADFKTAIEANKAAGAAGGGAGAAAAEALINGTENAGAAASAAAAANNGNNNQNNNNDNDNQNNGNNNNQNSNNNNNNQNTNNNNNNNNQNQNNNGNGGNNNRNGGNNNNGGFRNGFGNFFGNNKAKRQVLRKRLALPFLS